MTAMNLVIRRFIILLLLVLQGFAPLLHAHVHVMGEDDGVHIHGIATVSAHHEHELASLDKVVCSNTAFGLHSAIQKKNLLDIDSAEPADFISTAATLQFAVLIEKQSGLSRPGIVLPRSLFVFNSAPRAPPFSLS